MLKALARKTFKLISMDGLSVLFCHPFFHTNVTKSCSETLPIHVDAPTDVWYLDNVGAGCGILFVFAARYELQR